MDLLAQILFDWRIVHAYEETRQEGCKEAGGEKEDLEEKEVAFLRELGEGGRVIAPLRCFAACATIRRGAATNPVPLVLAADDPATVAELLRHLAAGGVAAVPTDTLYGLAANALDPAAIGRVFALKGRDFHKPLPVVVRDPAQAATLTPQLPSRFYELTAAFWPGPLTLVLPAAPHVPAALTAGTGTIALRQPNLPFLRALLTATGFPLTATSANRSGAPSCRTAAEVIAQLGEDCPLVVDAGPSPSALPSTILDLCASEPRLIRAGAIPIERLAPLLK